MHYPSKGFLFFLNI
uniref:Uncharacterized protein n=1 Tax=Arundo donax TaxID=35708 RepID=A0A0A9G167_ARUDO